jgi:hypothetical protein
MSLEEELAGQLDEVGRETGPVPDEFRTTNACVERDRRIKLARALIDQKGVPLSAAVEMVKEFDGRKPGQYRSESEREYGYPLLNDDRKRFLEAVDGKAP